MFLEKSHMLKSKSAFIRFFFLDTAKTVIL